MNNTDHAIDLLNKAKEKYDAGLDPSFQIMEAIKFVQAAASDVNLWKNKYLMKISEPVQ